MVAKGIRKNEILMGIERGKADINLATNEDTAAQKNSKA